MLDRSGRDSTNDEVGFDHHFYALSKVSLLQ